MANILQNPKGLFGWQASFGVAQSLKSIFGKKKKKKRKKNISLERKLIDLMQNHILSVQVLYAIIHFVQFIYFKAL